ncbi:hypothetical protein VTN96DRAFT_5570 [Rasamsonia emersonii]
MTTLGLFSRLPYEVREQIWLEFAPTGQDMCLRCTQKTDLRILCTSRDLYDEISRVLYQTSSLEFDLSPIHQPGKIWTTVHFKQGRHQQRVNARWILHSLADARSRGFHHLPFDRIDNVIVNLSAPNPKGAGRLFWLWQKVTDLVSLFKEAATTIRNLTIRLQKCNNKNGQDWLDRWGTANQSIFRLYDHDVVVVPFCTLRNLETIDVETHSKELEDTIDWKIMNWAMNAVWDRSWNHCVSADYTKGDEDGIAEHDVDRKVASDYFWIYKELWNYAEGNAANLARRNFLSSWFAQGSSGYSKFEQQILRINSLYPDIIQAYDPDMVGLSEMHLALVCLYHHARSLHGRRNNTEEPDYWDQEVWELAFPFGIPRSMLDEYRDKIEPLLDWDTYFDYVEEKGGFLSTFNHVLEEWKSNRSSQNPEEELQNAAVTEQTA